VALRNERGEDGKRVREVDHIVIQFISEVEQICRDS